jgi:uncharacterized repeat protein (TIGR03803 family)
MTRAIVICVALMAATGALGLAHGKPVLSGQETVLWSFGGPPDGNHPSGDVLLGDNGEVYGTTSSGGSAGLGTVYELKPKHGGGYTETIIYNFQGPDGANPYAGLVKIGKFTEAGTTRVGGQYGFGTVFAVTHTATSTKERVLYSFRDGAEDGAYPYAGLTVGPGGVLYGTTTNGGRNNCPGRCGTVFSLTPSRTGHSERILYRFRGGQDGYHPYAGVAMNANGTLFGSTYFGGTSDVGTAYELTPLASEVFRENVMHNFAGGDDGAYPFAPPLVASDGTLFGTTTNGGAAAKGTIYQLRPAPSGYTETITYAFSSGSPDGSSPVAAPSVYAPRVLVGTTEGGGEHSYGTVYRLARTTHGYQEFILYWFGSVNPSYDARDVRGGLTIDAAGDLFGSTWGGGKDLLGTVYVVKQPPSLRQR